MATDQGKPAGKTGPKTRKTARKKPSFEAAPAAKTGTGWAYRTDAAPETPRKPAPTRQADAPRPAAAARKERRASGFVESALDAAAVPFGIVLMAVLSPLGVRRRRV